MPPSLNTAPRSSWRLLLILFVVGIFNYLDRTLLSILQIPIQEELNLSDTQLGILLGASFAIVYTTAGLPLGRLADRTSRKTVLGVCLSIWTGLTALSGMATNFIMLLLCRMGVALGEASAVPISQSLISDSFPKKIRGTVVALWAVSLPIGIILGFLIGGWLSTELGWRQSFLIIGLIGLILVPIVYFGISDPERGAFEAKNAFNEEQPPLGKTLKMMWNTRSYRYILIAVSLHMFTFYSIMIWAPQFYFRTFEMSLNQVGLTMAAVAGVGGFIGMSVGGILVDRLAQKDQRWYVWLPALSAALLIPLGLLQFWVPAMMVSIGIGVLNGALLQLFYAPMIAVTQSVMPPRVRTFSGATYMFVANILSMSLGPLVGGALSDYFSAGSEGDSGLRMAITVTLVGCFLAVGFFLYAAKTLRSDLAKVDAETG